ncbi:MAG: hypothetical protein JSW07_08425 [bacterium]|nr:MAG: hypothetical protein JSW07_08425 [bacterium]
MRFKALCLLPVFISIMFGVTYGGELTSVSASPGDNKAGAYTIYSLTFTISDTGNGTNIGIPEDGKIVITFPAGFDVSEVEIASSTDPTLLNGGLIALSSGGVITVLRDST